jgi:hypothetical protein
LHELANLNLDIRMILIHLDLDKIKGFMNSP